MKMSNLLLVRPVRPNRAWYHTLKIRWCCETVSNRYISLEPILSKVSRMGYCKASHVLAQPLGNRISYCS